MLAREPFVAAWPLTLEGPLVVAKRFPVIEAVLGAHRVAGIPLQAIYLRIAEEIALVRDGKISETSCKDVPQDVVLGSVNYLESIQGVVIVSKEFEVPVET